MAQVGQVAISSEIPKALESFYLGEGKPGEAGYKPGLIERGVSAIFPTAEGVAKAQQAYQTQYAPIIQSGLFGAGAIAPMSQFQQAVGQRLAGMEMPQQFQIGTEAGQQAAAGLQALQGLQAMGVAAPDLTTYQLGPSRQFTAAEAQQYMSPYQQTVIDAQQRAAIDAAK